MVLGLRHSGTSRTMKNLLCRTEVFVLTHSSFSLRVLSFFHESLLVLVVLASTFPVDQLVFLLDSLFVLQLLLNLLLLLRLLLLTWLPPRYL